MQVKIKQITGLLSALKTPFEVSDTPPSDPVENQFWIDSTNLIMYLYLIDTNGPIWVEID